MTATCEHPVQSPSQTPGVTTSSRILAIAGLSLTMVATLAMALVMVPLEAVWWIKDRVVGGEAPAQSVERGYPECD